MNAASTLILLKVIHSYFCSNLYYFLPFDCFGFSFGFIFCFLRWNIRLLFWNLFSFNMVLHNYTFLSKHWVLAISCEFFILCFTCSFISKYFIILFVIFSLIVWLLRNVLFYFHSFYIVLTFEPCKYFIYSKGKVRRGLRKTNLKLTTYKNKWFRVIT